MNDDTLTGRSSFQSSGRINWARFIPFAALAWIASGMLAVLLLLLFIWGFYFVIIVPLVAALGVAGMVMLAVQQGHCRSRLAAGLLGVLCGITLYIGYYYAGMVRDVGLENAGRISFLPRYIAFRMKVQVIRDEHAPQRDDERKTPDAGGRVFNWVFFGVELAFAVFLPAMAGVKRAGKPYCEKCLGWMSREVTRFKPEVGPGFVEALRQGAVQSLAALFTSPQKAAAPLTAVALDYCPSLKSGKTTDCAVYMSVKQIAQNARGAVEFDSAKGKLLVRQTQMNPAELAALLPRFSVLEAVTGTTAAEALKDFKIQAPTQADLVYADVRPVDPQFAGKVLTTKTKLIGNASVFLLLLGIFAAIGLGFLGGVLGFPDAVKEVSPVMKILGSILIGLAIALFLADMVMIFYAPDYFGTRYLRRLIEREFARRPNHLVSPSDPAAHFVQVIPRENWAKLKLDDASDVGFMRLDDARKEILFEGDNEYIRIPAASITSCEVERFVAGEGTHGATAYYRLVLVANHPSATFWEVPFGPRGGTGKFRAKKREKWARDMEQRIKAMMFKSP